MLERKSMVTPMETNLKKLHEYGTVLYMVDLTMYTLYRHLVGSLMYLVNTRPNICYAENTLRQFMCEPRQIHLVAAKHILRYSCGTIGYGLKYSSDVELNLQGFSNSNWA